MSIEVNQAETSSVTEAGLRLKELMFRAVAAAFNDSSLASRSTAEPLTCQPDGRLIAPETVVAVAELVLPNVSVESPEAANR